MRYFLLILLGFVLYKQSSAQAIRLQNLMGTDYRSRTIYTGIDNKILVSPKNAAEVVRCEGCAVSISNDTIILQTSQRGLVRLSVTVAGGVQPFNFQAESLPEFGLMLEGHSKGTVHLSRFVMGQKFVVVTNGRDYWSQFKLTRFACVVNNQAVVNNSPAPGKEIADALLRAPRGSMVTITSIVLTNKKTKRKEFIRKNMLFVVE